MAIYNQYKADTNSIFQWILKTAQKVIDTEQRPQQNGDQSGNKTKSGKSKKNLKKGTGNQNADCEFEIKKLENVSFLVQRITESNFFIQAVESNKPFMPYSIYQLFKRAIQGRLEFAEIYSSILNNWDSSGTYKAGGLQKEKLQEDISRHDYFNRLLQDILKLLRGDLWSIQQVRNHEEAINEKRQRIQGEQDQFNSLSNRFDALMIDSEDEEYPETAQEDIQTGSQQAQKSEWLPGSMVQAGQKNKPKSKIRVKAGFDFDVKNDSGTMLFKLWCAHVDIYQIYKYVEETWQQHRDRRLSLFTAAYVTTAASDMVHKIEQGCLIEYPSHIKDYRSMVEIFLPNNTSMEDIIQMEPDQIRSFPGIQKLGVVLYNMQIFVLTYRLQNEVFQNNSVSLPKQGYFGSFNENQKPEQITQKETLYLLSTQIPEYIVLDQACGSHVLGGDALVKLSAKLYKKKPITQQLIFAEACFLNSVHIMRGRLKDSFKMVKFLTQLYVSDIDALKERNVRIGTDMKETLNLNSLHDMIGDFKEVLVGQILQDATYPFKKHAAETSGEISKEHYYYELNPWLCGAALNQIVFQMQDFGLNIIQCQGFYAAASHIYNALRVFDLIEEIPVFESSFRPLGEWLFRGQKPKRDFGKNFALFLGQTPLGAKQNEQARQGKGAVRTNKRGKAIDHQHMSLSYCYYKEKNMEKVLKEMEFDRRKCRYKHAAEFPNELVLTMLKDMVELEQTWNKCVGLNYFRIHLYCIEIMKRVHNKLKISNLAMSSEIESEAHIPFLAITVLEVLDSEQNNLGDQFKASSVTEKVVESYQEISNKDVIISYFDF